MSGMKKGSGMLATPNTCEAMKQQNLSYIAGEIATWYSQVGIYIGSFLEN